MWKLDEDDKAKVIAGLRQLADFLEATPDALLDFAPTIAFYGATPEAIRALARSGGKFDKQYVGGILEVSRSFEGGVKYEMNISREQVCTARVVGTREVERTDPNAPKITVTEDVVEWDCEPLLAPSSA